MAGVISQTSNARVCVVGDSTTMGENTPIVAITHLAPALTILNVGISDWGAGTSVATLLSTIAPFVTAAQLSGDVMLAVGVPSPLTTTNTPLQPAYEAALAAYAQQRNVPFVDFQARWVSWTAANTLGLSLIAYTRTARLAWWTLLRRTPMCCWRPR